MERYLIDRGAASRGARSETDILADARDMQARHAPAAFAAVGRWMRGRLAERAELPSAPVARRLVIH